VLKDELEAEAGGGSAAAPQGPLAGISLSELEIGPPITDLSEGMEEEPVPEEAIVPAQAGSAAARGAGPQRSVEGNKSNLGAAAPSSDDGMPANGSAVSAGNAVRDGEHPVQNRVHAEPSQSAEFSQAVRELAWSSRDPNEKKIDASSKTGSEPGAASGWQGSDAGTGPSGQYSQASEHAGRNADPNGCKANGQQPNGSARDVFRAQEQQEQALER
jgi:hypothetical protein